MGRTLRIGFYSPYLGSTVGGGEKYLLLAARALKDAHPEHTVELLAPVPIDRQRYESMLDLDLEGLVSTASAGRVTALHRWANRSSILRGLRNRTLSARAGRATAGLDLLVAMAYVIPLRSRARRGVILCQFPYRLRTAAELDPFQMVVAQSDYVSGWVRRLWGRGAEVVAPPIDVPEAAPDWSAKEHVILSVGRFFSGGHAKHQDLMVRAFRELCDAGLSGWRLHLAGSVHRAAQHAGYFEQVAELARGYPVTLHPDAAYGEIQDLYRQAAIYWHAAGFGADPEADPAALEHFGMTTVEAMAHGAVPLVYGAAGPAEVVGDGADGFHWLELPTLAARTVELAGDPGLRRRLGERARERSQAFARPFFMSRMAELLRPVVRELEGP